MTTFKPATTVSELNGRAVYIESFTLRTAKASGKQFYVVSLMTGDQEHTDILLPASQKSVVRFTAMQQLIEERALAIGPVVFENWIPDGEQYPRILIKRAQTGATVEAIRWNDALLAIGEYSLESLVGHILTITAATFNYETRMFVIDAILGHNQNITLRLKDSKSLNRFVSEELRLNEAYQVVQKQFTPRGSREVVSYYALETYIPEYDESLDNTQPF